MPIHELLKLYGYSTGGSPEEEDGDVQEEEEEEDSSENTCSSNSKLKVKIDLKNKSLSSQVVPVLSGGIKMVHLFSLWVSGGGKEGPF